MQNIFDTIVGRLPKPNQADVAKLNQLELEERVGAQPAPAGLAFSKLPMRDMVVAWQKDPSDSNTTILLNKLKPTMSSAITSYAAGMDNDLAIKAAKLTLNALKTYDPNAGTEPSTYVFHNLKRLNRVAAERNAIIRYPEQQMADIAKVTKYMTEFEDDNGREPSLAEIADHTGMSAKKIDKLLSAATVTSESSQDSVDNGDSLIGNKDVGDSDYFEYVYTSVSPIDQKIMEWSSGMHGKPMLSNNDIAARLKISAAAVSQRKNKIQQALSDIRGVL